MALACSKETSAPTPTNITVSINVVPAFAEPGDTIRVTATAVPAGGISVELIRLVASGLVTASDQVSVSGGGSHSYAHAYVLPFQPASGSVSFVATAEGGGATGSAQTTVSVADAVKPVVSSLSVSPPALQPGEWITVSYTATDNVGLFYTVVRVSGAVTAVDSLGHGFASTITRSVQFRVPVTAHVGDTVRVRVVAADEASQRDSAVAGPVSVTDLAPPLVGGSATGPETALTLVTGDTLRVTVNATDNHRLAWIGYRLGPPASVQDSVAVAAATGNHLWTPVVQSGWLGTSSVTAFARDSLGHVAQTSLGDVTVVAGIRRPTRTAPLGGTVLDVVYSAPRDALYLSQPFLDRIAVLSLGSFTFGTPIALFSQPRGLDLSVGGDTLIVALRNSPYLAVVNLISGQVDTVRLGIDNFLNRGPDNVRVLGNNKAIVTITFDGSGYGGQVWEYDLGAGTARQRTDAGIGGQVTEVVPLARAGDRSRLLILIDDSCCPLEGDVYLTATDTVSVKRGTVNRYFPRVSATATGSLFLIGESLFDGNLNFMRAFAAAEYVAGPTAISPDGLSVYMAIDFGYLKLRAADGAVIERVRLPASLDRMTVLPSGDWLVGIGGDPTSGAPVLEVVDLR